MLQGCFSVRDFRFSLQFRKGTHVGLQPRKQGQIAVFSTKCKRASPKCMCIASFPNRPCSLEPDSDAPIILAEFLLNYLEWPVLLHYSGWQTILKVSVAMLLPHKFLNYLLGNLSWHFCSECKDVTGPRTPLSQ